MAYTSDVCRGLTRTLHPKAETQVSAMNAALKFSRKLSNAGG
jgi:hypothetical protein